MNEPLQQKPKAHPHIRKPAKNHPWHAQGAVSKSKSQRAAEPQALADRKAHRRWGAE